MGTFYQRRTDMYKIDEKKEPCCLCSARIPDIGGKTVLRVI